MITQKKLAGNYTKEARKLWPILRTHTVETTIKKSSPKLTCMPEKNTRSPCMIQVATELMVAITKSTMPLTPQIQVPFWSKDRVISLIKYSATFPL
jgi:hypothetical protein